MKIKGVIFDLDGTITDSETYARKAMQQVFINYGYSWDDDFYNSLIGITPQQGEAICTEYFGSRELALEILERYSKVLFDYLKKGEVAFKPGAIETITFLNENNIPIALATSASETKLKLSFNAHGMEVPFKTIINAGMVKHCKPDPEVFLKAAEALNLDIHDCMVIEDSTNGIMAAISAGSISVLVPDYIVPPVELQQKATYVKKDLFEVLDIIKANI